MINTNVNELDIDTGIQVIDAYSKSGFNDEIELSVGNWSRVVVLFGCILPEEMGG